MDEKLLGCVADLINSQKTTTTTLIQQTKHYQKLVIFLVSVIVFLTVTFMFTVNNFVNQIYGYDYSIENKNINENSNANEEGGAR
jgi:hypothetical protein